jgi:UPF0755 protein
MTLRKSIHLAIWGSLFAFALYLGFGFGTFLFHGIAPPQPQTLTISPGTPFAAVAHQLETRGIVASDTKLKILARIRGNSGRIQAGEYLFVDKANPDQVLARLIAGDVVRRRFTIPEGLTIKEIAARLEAERVTAAEPFITLATDPALAESLGIDGESLEGYLFPETYTYTAGTSPRELLGAMVEQFRARMTPELLSAAEEEGLTLHQLVTLASIIQKEAGNNEEMPLISAVFRNRLKQRIPLQADPTVIYGIENFDGNLTRLHLTTPTPYNTYRMVGLPRGPIANPGEEALQAAAFPAAVTYLYFVSRGDGTHKFSNTLREHNQAVQRYQLHR